MSMWQLSLVWGFSVALGMAIRGDLLSVVVTMVLLAAIIGFRRAAVGEWL